jgi:hypothetical protein
LLIDDEADNASINTKKPECAPSAINGHIRNLYNNFPIASYVGYTATPFANIFVNPEGDETAKPSLFAGCAITPKWLEDIVFYNVSAHGINGNVIVAARIRNSAFVNVDVDTVNEGAFSRFTDKMENVYLKNFKQPKAELDWHQGDVKKAGALSPVHVRAYNIISKKMYGFPTFDGSQGLLVQEEDLQW